MPLDPMYDYNDARGRRHGVFDQQTLPPEPPVGTVLVYVVQLGQREYHYASLRAGDGRWYTTGSSTQQGVNWAALVRALRAKQARVSINVGWREWSL